MGQCLSAPKPSTDAQDFLNLPKEAVEALWTAYNLLGEGWGLSEAEVINIFNGAPFIVKNYSFGDDQFKKLFKSFDTDNNGLIDALELFAAIALVSGMDTIDKVNFCFSAFDFDSVGSLSYDEATLMLRSAVKGLAKVCPSNIVFSSPTAATIEKYAALMFLHSVKSTEDDSRVTLGECKHYCSVHPVVSSWLKAVAMFPSASRSEYALRVEAMSGDVLPATDEEVMDLSIDAAAFIKASMKFAAQPQLSASVISEKDFAKLEAAREAKRLSLLTRKPKASDIVKTDDEEEDEEADANAAEEAKIAAEEEALKAAAAPVAAQVPPWVAAVNLMQPEEMPEGLRFDSPEDVFEAVWVGGLNTSRLSTESASTISQIKKDIPLMHRCVRYGPAPVKVVADEEAAAGDEAIGVAPVLPVIFTAANHLVQMKKQEDAEATGWSQEIFTRHSAAQITAFDVNVDKNLLVTGDSAGLVNVWDLTTFAVKQTFWTTTAIGGNLVDAAAFGGVKLLDASADGSQLLVLASDPAATATIYDLRSGKIVFSKSLLPGAKAAADSVLDVRFTGTSAMFVGAFAKQELTFFVEEGGSFMGETGLRNYEERTALYQTAGKAAVGAAVMEICRFELDEEIVCGTEKGQVLLWRGRSCAQLLEAHSAPVTALDFNVSTLTLLTGAANGTVNMYSMAAAPPTAPSARGPVIHSPRLLELSAAFDIHNHDLCCFSLRSIAINTDSTRALLSTGAGEVVEVTLVITPLSAEEIAELEAAAVEAADAANAAAAAEAEEGVEVAPIAPDAVPSTKGNIGDNAHGAPLVVSHFNAAACSSTDSAAAAAPRITALCRIAAGGFVSCGEDGTVRWWQGAGGTEETGATAYAPTKVLKMDSGCSKIDACASFLAIALDGSAPNTARKGSVHIFSVPEMQFAMDFSEPKDVINDLKFNSEGTLLAAACADGLIYVYQQIDSVWSAKGSISTTTAKAAASTIDFSADGLYLRSFYPNTLMFRVWDIAASSFGKDITDLSAPPPKPTLDPETGEELPVEESGPPLDLLRSLTWQSHSCAHNWDTKGTNALALADAPAATDRSNHLLLSALADGSVGVDRVPAVYFRDESRFLVRLAAHLGPVASLVFIDEGARLVTAGACDGTIRVWKVQYDMDEFEPDFLPGADDAEAADVAEDEGEEEEGKPKLEVIYDSSEEDDLLDGDRMKEHLSRDNRAKRATYKVQTEAALVKAADDSAAAEQAALQFAVAGSEAAPLQGDGTDSVLTASQPLYSEEEMVIDELSGVRFWAEKSLGLKAATMAGECKRALAAAPSLLPHDELELHWVYGSTLRSTRGAVHYSKDGAIVYPAGTMGVIFDKLENTQKRAAAHCDEITALDLHAESNVAVSAHKGSGDIEATTWSAADGTLIQTFQCGAVNGVSAAKFSPDAKYVALACLDAEHTVKIFRTASGQLCASYKSGEKKILSIAFSLAPASPTATTTLRLLVGGVLHFKLLTFAPSSGTICAKTGGYGADVKKSNVLCAVALPLQVSGEGEVTGNEFALGMSDGSIALLSKGESKVAGFSPTMKGPVTALAVAKLKDGTAEEPPVLKIVAGGINGQLKVLDQELQPLAEFNLYLPDRGLQPLGRLRGFKSLAVDKSNRKILYGTAGGEIGEVELETGVEVNEERGVLVNSHFRDSLHALSAHPLRHECVTAGDDKTLRVWDLQQRRMLTSIQLPDIARAVAFSPNGHLLVAGLGGEVAGGDLRNPREMSGKVAVVSYLQGVLRIVHLTSDAKDAISCVLFTPDGSKMIAASLDGDIYVYDALNNFQLVVTLSGHAEAVVAIDISASGQYVVSMGARTELCCWDLNTGTKADSADACFEVLANVALDWRVRQCAFGISSIGVFPPFSDPVDVRCLHQSKDAKLLVVGDSFGALKLFKNPCCDLFAPSRSYFAHSPGGISRVAFSFEDTYVLSTGTNDRSLLQWKVRKSSVAPDNKIFVESTAIAVAAVDEVDGAFADSFVLKGVDLSVPCAANSSSKLHVQVQLQSIFGTGNSIFNAPSAESCSLPVAKYFGLGDVLTCFGKVPALLEGSAASVIRPLWATPAAPALGVTHYNNPLQAQVTAMAVSPCGRFAMIGQRNSRLQLVGAPAGKLLCELPLSCSGKVSAVCFAPTSKLCASLSDDEQHSLHIFRSIRGDWADAAVLAMVQVSAASVNLLSFLSASTTVSAAFDLATAGTSGHIKFWKIVGRNLLGVCGNYGDIDGAAAASTRPAFTALEACSSGGEVVTGDSTGELHVWRAAKKLPPISAHSSAVTALKAFSGGFVSASNDKILVWSTVTKDASEEVSPASPALLKSISVPSVLSSCGGWTSAIYLSDDIVTKNFVTSIDCDALCERLLLGFSTSPIVTVATDSLNALKICEGHSSDGKVVAIAAHPAEPCTVLTIAQDRILRVWDVSAVTVEGSRAFAGASALVGVLNLFHEPTALTFLNAETLLVAVAGADTGGKSGSILVVHVSPAQLTLQGTDMKFNLTITSRIHNVGNGAVSSICIAPKKKYLAACSNDGCVYVYSVNEAALIKPAASNDPSQPAAEEKASDRSSITSGSDVSAENAFPALGFLLAHPTGAPVAAVDFSANCRYARTFGSNRAGSNGKVEVNYFDFELLGAGAESAAAVGGSSGRQQHAAGKVVETLQIEAIRAADWASCNSAAAPSLRAVNYSYSQSQLGAGEGSLKHVVSHVMGPHDEWVCATYSDGSATVFRCPANDPEVFRSNSGAQKLFADLALHSESAPALCAFAVGSAVDRKEAKLVTVSQADGTLMVWKVN